MRDTPNTDTPPTTSSNMLSRFAERRPKTAFAAAALGALCTMDYLAHKTALVGEVLNETDTYQAQPKDPIVFDHPDGIRTYRHYQALGDDLFKHQVRAIKSYVESVFEDDGPKRPDRPALLV